MSSSVPTGFLALPDENDRHVARLRRKLGLLLLQRLLTHDGAGLPAGMSALQRALPPIARAHPEPLHAACANLDFRVAALAGDWAAAIPAFLLALARRLPSGVLEETILWDRPLDRIPDRGGDRILEFAPPARGLVVHGGGAELRDATGRPVDLLARDPVGECPFHPIHPGRGTPYLATVDTNPLAMLEAHPEKQGNAVDLGGRSPREWCDALDEAFESIEVALPRLHAEMTDSVERIVPVGFHPERHLSASYLEGPGLVYLTLHPDPLTMAEALIHESQHGKLNLLSWFDPVLRNGHTDWASSPVRPDLRPLHGVLMAVHAFVPVAALHHRLAALDHPFARTPGFARRRAEVLGANASGLATLRERSEPTELGGRVLEALGELHAAIAAAAPTVDGEASLETLG